jgi:hypothetical protein
MDERMRILELIESGEISAEEGARRLEAPAQATEGPRASAAAPAVPVPQPALVRWLWQCVFWTGGGLLAGGGFLLLSFYTREVPSRWLTWGWILSTLGVMGVLLGWWLQRAHWLSVRVRQSDGPNIFVALPLPLGPIAWILRIARPFVPQLDETGVDELLLAMRDEMRDGRPLLVEVNEGEGGEQVQVYIG